MLNPQGPDRAAFVAAATQVRSWRRPILVTHTKPDGDALGALFALCRLLAGQGVSARAVIFDPVPDRYSALLRLAPLTVLGRDCAPADLSAADGVVILDTCTYNQLEPIAAWLREAQMPKLALDHHVTREAIADQYLIDESAAAACLIMYDWARAAGWPIDAGTASALFVGVATDTGWFRHSNTDARVLAAASELTTLGARPNELFQELYQRDSAARVRVLGAALDSLELLANDRLAVMRLPLTAFARAYAVHADTEDIVNEPLRIGTVVVSMLLIEQENGLVRVNLRSKMPLDSGTPDVDVAAVATTFGGGGHRRAAGARIHSSLNEAYRMLVEAMSLRL